MNARSACRRVPRRCCSECGASGRKATAVATSGALRTGKLISPLPLNEVSKLPWVLNRITLWL